MDKLKLSTGMEAYEWLNGDLDAIDDLPNDMKADLLVDFENWSHELTSEAMAQYDANSAEWIFLLFSENRPEDDRFIIKMREACWYNAKVCIQEAMAAEADIDFNPYL